MFQGENCLYSEIQDKKETLKNKIGKIRTYRKWFYKDPDGTERGSFSFSLMKKWFRKKYMPLDTLVRCEGEQEFIEINKRRILFEDKQTTGLKKELTCKWEYIDDKGTIQGPFDKFILQNWKNLDYLPYDTLVRKVGEMFFTPWKNRLKFFTKILKKNHSVIDSQNNVKLMEEKKWFYLSQRGNPHGPFQAQIIENWFKQSFFDLNTRIRSNTDPLYLTIGEKRPPPSWLPCIKFVLTNLTTFKPIFINISQSKWIYKTNGGKVKGPFFTYQINLWHRDGYFNKNVKIRLVKDPVDNWKSIGKTICFFRPSLQRKIK